MLFQDPTSDVISVSALNRLARQLLENGLPARWIGGEISNLTLAASGHAYFSLKDASAQVRCVMFRQRLAQLGFRPREGMQVELRGSVTLYEARGEYQITVDTLREAGLGRLFEAFERLKRQLATEGLFDEHKKRALPGHPKAIGIVTSPAAAALRDVVSTLRRRMPNIPLILYPTPVQGSDAGRQIAAAIRSAGDRREVEVLIVCRGGGSMEDLWAFNEEAVARAIASCPIPVISGVGHETDFTIADFVADRRAPTPTAAAELASPSREHMQQQLERGRRALVRALARQIVDKGQRLDYLARRLAHPGERLDAQARQLAMAEQRLKTRLQQTLQQGTWRLQSAMRALQQARPRPPRSQQRLQQLENRLAQALRTLLTGKQQATLRLSTALDAMNPQAVLERGYAIVHNAHGRAIRRSDEVHDGERVTLQLAHGQLDASVQRPGGAQAQLPF